MERIDLSSLVRLVERVGILAKYVFDHADDLAPEYLRPHFAALAPITEERVIAVTSELRLRANDPVFEESLSAHGLTGVELAAKMAAADTDYDAFDAARRKAEARASTGVAPDESLLDKLKRALTALGIPLGSLSDLLPGAGALGEILQIILHAIEHTERKRKSHPTGRIIFTDLMVQWIARLFRRRRSRETTPS